MKLLGGGLLVVVLALLPAAPAGADRKPTAAEEPAIERVGVQACARPPGDCAFRGARVSTANERYAWANVIAEGFSGALLKRPSRTSTDFKVVGTQGGGIGECRYWRKRAPRKVLRDLRIRGLVKSGAVRNCGKRAKRQARRTSTAGIEGRAQSAAAMTATSGAPRRRLCAGRWAR